MSKVLSAPTRVTLMITRRCNLRCLHCGSSSEQFLRGDMTTEELLAVIDQLARCKVLLVAISGGEPLMHPDFLRIVDAIMRHPMRWQLDTNATLVTQVIAARLAGLARKPFISVSIDGATPETHDHIRGDGSLAQVTRGMAILRAADLFVRPFMVLSRLNYRELPAVAELVRSMGITTLNVTPPMSCGRAVRHMQEMAMQPNELREALETTVRIDETYPHFLTGPWAHVAGFYRKLKHGVLTTVEETDGTFQNCGAGRSSLTISSDGTVVPCDMSHAYRAGNVREQSLEDIWNNSRVFATLRQCRGMPLSEVHGCENCAWHHACRGPCPAGGHALTGLWPAAEPTCAMREVGKLFGHNTFTNARGKVLPWKQQLLARPS